ncbi:DUF3574 domain-containing protein [Streptomyces sp. M19]
MSPKRTLFAMRPRVRFAALGTAAVLVAGTPVAAYAAFDDAPAPPPRPRPRPGKPYVETRLFFGTQRPDGGPPVTDKQFLAFVDDHVTPSFPAGLTIQDGRGQWRDQHGTIERERSYVLTLLYPAAEARARDPRIETVRDAYEKEFGQESVARADEAARVDF